MGILDQLWGEARSAAGSEECGRLASALLSSLGGGSGQADQASGLAKLIGKFEQSGLGPAVQSWISTKQQNHPVTPDQVQKALGAEHVQEIARRTGLPASAVAAALAAILPSLVDRMTPNGQAPTSQAATRTTTPPNPGMDPTLSG